MNPNVNYGLWELYSLHSLKMKGKGHQGTCRKHPWALAGVAQWIECRPTNHRVAGSIPSQGTRLGCGPGP